MEQVANPTLQLAEPAAPTAPAPAAAQAEATKVKAPKLKSEKEEAPANEADTLPNPLLLNILGTRRAHGTLGDSNFRIFLHAEIRKIGYSPVIEKEGSIVVVVDPKSTTLFSCHIDTCHSTAESNTNTRQVLVYDPIFSHIFLQDKTGSSCLGGDDGVGVYIMLRMLQAKVPGTYIFHTGEERGGIGSRAILKNSPDRLAEFDRCIAFDRAVHDGEQPEVIVTQGGMTCASVPFGMALVAELNKGQFSEPWVVSHRGSFTDSKVYAGIIPECVNVGCFYVNQHTPNEVVNASGVEALLDICLKIKWESLKPVRKPEAEAPKPYYSRFNAGADDLDAGFYRAVGMPERPGRQAAAPAVPAPRQGQLKLDTTQSRVNAKKSKAALDKLLSADHEAIADMIDLEPEKLTHAICALVSKYKGLQTQLAVMEDFYGT